MNKNQTNSSETKEENASGGFVIDTELLKSINNAILVNAGFSENETKKSFEFEHLEKFLLEPIKRFEFNILVSLFDNSFNSYKDLIFGQETYKYFGKDNTDYFVSIPTIDIREIINDSPLVTLTSHKEKSRTVLKIKPAFRMFTSEDYFSDDLYKKLFELGFDYRIRTLYYFIYKNRYDFIDVLKEESENVYNIIKFIDVYIYTCMRGYHKPLLKELSELNTKK